MVYIKSSIWSGFEIKNWIEDQFRTDGQTQATTTPEDQNWPRVITIRAVHKPQYGYRAHVYGIRPHKVRFEKIDSIYRCHLTSMGNPTVDIRLLPYFHDGISYTGKTTSLYWIRPQVIWSSHGIHSHAVVRFFLECGVFISFNAWIISFTDQKQLCILINSHGIRRLILTTKITRHRNSYELFTPWHGCPSGHIVCSNLAWGIPYAFSFFYFRFGRRITFGASFLVKIFGALLTVINSYNVLLVGRFFQGMGSMAASQCGLVIRKYHVIRKYQDDVIKWEFFSRFWSFVRGIHREFPSQRPVTRSFDVFFDLCLNKRVSINFCK